MKDERGQPVLVAVASSQAGPDCIRLELFDRAIRCIVDVLALRVTDPRAFAAALDVDLGELIATRAIYKLDPSDLDWIESACGSPLDFSRGEVALSAWGEGRLDALPYAIHTRRELAMMLAGTKPLAVFGDVYPSPANLDVIPEDLFAPHVASGRFVQREFVIPDATLPPPYKGLRCVLYALAVEAWRIDAMIALKTAGMLSGWSAGCERMEGALLGYAEWQNAAFMANWAPLRRGKSAP